MRSSLLLGFLTLATACGGDGTADAGQGAVDAAPISQASYAENLAEATCDALERCGCEELMAYGERPTYPNPDACRYEEGLALEEFVAAAVDAGLEFDETCAGEHRERLEQRGCDWAGDLIEECNPCPVIHGDKPLGVECEVYPGNPAYSDCARGLVCPNSESGGPSYGSVCVEACPEVIMAAESCDDDAANSNRPLPCVDGTYCAAGVCTPALLLGEPCTRDDQCVSDAHCDDEVCVPKSALGEVCDLNQPCAQGSCLYGVDPDGSRSASRVCTAAGEPCVESAGGSSVGAFFCVDETWTEIGGVCSRDVTRQLYSRWPL